MTFASKPIARWTVRVLCLVAAVAFALGGPLPNVLRRALPSLSPLLLAANSIASRSWYAGLFWGIPPLVVAALSVTRGRLFCRWVCPAGTLYSCVKPLSLKKRLLSHRLSGYVFWTIVFGSLAGFPLLIALDPLSSFSRMTPFMRGWYRTAALVPGLLVPLFLVLSAVQPMLWCTHVCPLGYLVDLVYMRNAASRIKQSTTRREIVVGLAVGLPLGILGRRLGIIPEADGRELPILPPGAETPEQFAAACSRCYACVNACPTDVLTVRMPRGRTLGQFFHPELDTNQSYCEEFCSECTHACPAGAIKPLTLERKRMRKIGTARVERSACLAWAEGEYCMVCEEYCPYHAIRTDESVSGIPRPLVEPDICRGCGICQANCPAVRAGRAIIVHGVAKQTVATEFELPAEEGPEDSESGIPGGLRFDE